MWKTIEDNKIRHVWKDKESGEELVVPPTFYEDAGTPIGEASDDDCVYLRTEIEVPNSEFGKQETSRNLMLSTCHFSEKDNGLLGMACENAESAVYDLKLGFLIHPKCFLQHYTHDRFSCELIALLKLAQSEGFDYVHFDRDAPKCYSLPTFDW